MEKSVCYLLGVAAVFAIMLVPAAVYAQQSSGETGMGAAAAPTITSPATGDVLNSNTVTITGTSAPASAVVVVGANNEFLGRAQASLDGTWTLEFNLPDGMYELTAVTRPNPDTFLRSNTIMISVSGGSDLPRLTIMYPPSGSILHDGTATVSGMAPPNYPVHLYDDSKDFLIGTVAGDDGRWSADIHLHQGMHFVVAVAAPTTEEISYVIDVICAGEATLCATALHSNPVVSDRIFLAAFGEEHTSPVQPKLTSPISGATISENTFVLNGISEPNTPIEVRNMFLTTLGTTTSDDAGMWSLEISDGAGVHIYSIISPTEEHPFIHTLQFLHIEGEKDNQQPTITYPENGAVVTSGNNVLLRGTAAPGSIMLVSDLRYVILATAIADSAGDWSATVDLNDGATVLVAAQITDGVISAHTEFTLVQVASGAPELDSPVITSFGTVSLHRDTSVTISGTAPSNSRVHVFSNEAEIATAMSDGAGAWSTTVDLPDGLYFTYVVASSGDAAMSGPSELSYVFVNSDDSRPKVCR